MARAAPPKPPSTPPAKAAKAPSGTRKAPSGTRKAPAGTRKTVRPGKTPPPAAKPAPVVPWGKAEIDEAFARLAAAMPEPKGELEYKNPFTLLVAVVLSAQATDAGVNKATRPLFATVDTPAKMAALGEERLREAIRTIGLYRTKAKNVIALAGKLIAEHAGAVPRERAALEALPGVGRKTANVVLNIAFGEPTIAVDTHVFRVSNRTGLAPGKTVLDVEQRLEKVVPDAYRQHAHHWLILHGRYVCKALRPLCETCVINTLCRWPGNPFAPPAPRKRQRAA